MSASPWSNVSCERLMESITLLKMLTEVPGSQMENDLPQSLDSARQLSIEREKELVDNLAFLSATTDNPNKVMAICIEEDHDLHGMTIRLAANTGDLSKVNSGFKDIARILERAASRGP